MLSSDEEEEIYDGGEFHAGLLACPAVVGDLVNIPVDLLPRKWVRACEIHPQTVLIGSVLARRAAGARETVVVRVEGYDRHLLVPGDHESVNQVVERERKTARSVYIRCNHTTVKAAVVAGPTRP